MVPRRFFVTDAREVPGNVYQIDGTGESVFYTTPRRRIYGAAFSPTGRLYFVDANERAIYRLFRFLWFRFTLTVHTHTTYVRDVGFDPAGVLYFSEASGAGGDGKIYRLGGSPSLFRDVPLTEVGGFWAGNFAFDHAGTLYISSGNRVPASIYRLEDGVWTEIFTDEAQPIKGLTFLACDLLAYANWRSEVYILDVAQGSRNLIYSNPIHLWVSDVALLDPRIEEDTLYEGPKTYRCNSTCWREDGTINETGIFTDIDANTPEIAALLTDIGVPGGPVTDDGDVWDRTRTVWAWLQSHGLTPGHPNYEDVHAYRAGLGRWPTIADLAYMFQTWGGFVWGSGCTCMCRAQMLATLLYRAGLGADRMAIAEARTRPTYSQHMYVVLKLGCHWFYIDPSVNLPELPVSPENVGAGTADYTHPNNLIVLPGSTMRKPMLVR